MPNFVYRAYVEEERTPRSAFHDNLQVSMRAYFINDSVPDAFFINRGVSPFHIESMGSTRRGQMIGFLSLLDDLKNQVDQTIVESLGQHDRTLRPVTFEDIDNMGLSLSNSSVANWDPEQSQWVPVDRETSREREPEVGYVSATDITPPSTMIRTTYDNNALADHLLESLRQLRGEDSPPPPTRNREEETAIGDDNFPQNPTR